MKILAFVFFLVASVSYAQNRSIQFQSITFEEALQKAKSEHKIIFMDAYTSWCGPCKWMARNMFTRDEIADFYNKNFINVKFDMEKGEGIDIAKRYDVRCYPNLLFIDAEGKLVHRQAGAAEEVHQYIEMGETAMNPDKRFDHLLTDYASGKRDAAFMLEFITAMSMTCLPYDQYVQAYFDTQKEEQLIEATNWNIFFHHQNDYKSKEFKYFLKELSAFEERYSADSVNMKLNGTFLQAAQSLVYRQDFNKKEFDQFKNEIKTLGFKGNEGVLFHIELMYLDKEGDLKKMLDYAFTNGSGYYTPDEINSVCWTAYEKSDDQMHLKTAETWMERITGTDPGHNYMYLDTYAAVLFKLKKKEAAKAAAEEAIRVAKLSGLPVEEYAATEELLKKIAKLK